MSYQLTPSAVNIGGQLIETYDRITNCNEDRLAELGLDPNNRPNASISVASIQEYILLQASNVVTGNNVTWDLSRIEQAVAIEAIHIDAPAADTFTFQLLRQNSIIFTFNLLRDKTPYQFPTAPLTPDLVIKFIATRDIDLVRIVLKPVIILDVLLPDLQVTPIGVN